MERLTDLLWPTEGGHETGTHRVGKEHRLVGSAPRADRIAVAAVQGSIHREGNLAFPRG